MLGCEKYALSRLFKACRGADLLISSLLATRDGPTDDLLKEIQQACRGAIEYAKPG